MKQNKRPAFFAGFFLFANFGMKKAYFQFSVCLFNLRTLRIV